MDTMTPTPARKKKSEPLSKVELAALKSYVKRFHAIIDCAEAVGISREVLTRVTIVGSGSPETIAKIRVAIGVETINAEANVATK
jgi:DNA-binding phage protein